MITRNTRYSQPANLISHRRKPKSPPPPPNQPPPGGTGQAGRYFAEPTLSPDEVNFRDNKSDTSLYSFMVKKLAPLPAPTGRTLIMKLEEVLPMNQVQAVQKAGRIVFHSVGDTGALQTPSSEASVADKMVEDFRDPDPANRPAFFYHLGDIVYSFGEHEKYYDQFYEPFRNYPAPIFAIPGNHDGVLNTQVQEKSLEAFLAEFCSTQPVHSPQSGGLVRTTMTQPGVYFTLEAPFVTIIGLYTNVLENPGVISSEGQAASPVSDAQKLFLISELKRLALRRKAGDTSAVLVAMHHPPYSAGAIHGPSPRMLADLEDAIKQASFMPDAVLSGHAHNYQRFTRQLDGAQIPFIIAGSGGHAVNGVKTLGGNPIRTPMVGTPPDHTLEKYILAFGYLRVIVTPALLSIEFHQAGANSSSPADVCTVDLKTHQLTAARPVSTLLHGLGEHRIMPQPALTLARGREAMTQQPSKQVRPMNVHVARGSSAEKAFRARAGLPGLVRRPEAIAPGISPTRAHDLRYHGGKTIPDLAFMNFYVGGPAAWQPDDIQSIDQALAAAMSDTELNNVMMQYFRNQPITSVFLSAQVLPGVPPTVVSQGDVEQMVSDLYSRGQLGGVDLGATVFNFMLPGGTVLNTDSGPSSQGPSPGGRLLKTSRRGLVIPHDEDDSLHGLGGYHGSVHIPNSSGGRDTVYYAVGVYSDTRPDGTTNGIVAFDEPWKNVAATFYHELNEARTDADVQDAINAGAAPDAAKYLGWTSHQGEECGDFPVFEASPLSQVFQEVPLATGGGTVPVQFQYSNAVHGPEGPITAPHSLKRPPHVHA